MNYIKQNMIICHNYHNCDNCDHVLCILCDFDKVCYLYKYDILCKCIHNKDTKYYSCGQYICCSQYKLKKCDMCHNNNNNNNNRSCRLRI